MRFHDVVYHTHLIGFSKFFIKRLKYGPMYFMCLFQVILMLTVSVEGLKSTKAKINVPYVAPNKSEKSKGSVVLDYSEGGNGELPFVEIANGDAYFYKNREDYKGNSYTKKEKELEGAQSEAVSHFDFLNDLIGNWRARV